MLNWQITSNCNTIWINHSTIYCNQSSLGAYIYIYICRLPTAQSLLFFENGGGKYMIIDHKIRCLCWMSWWRTSQLIIAGDVCGIQGDFSTMHSSWKHQMWCWWKSLAWPTRAIRCPPRIIFLMDVILYFCVFVVT